MTKPVSTCRNTRIATRASFALNHDKYVDCRKISVVPDATAKSGWRQYLYIGKPHDLLQAETIVILLDMRTLHVETGKTDKACDPDRDR